MLERRRLESVREAELDQRADSRIWSEPVLPEQFFSAFRARGPYQGERRLVIAVLEDAVHCFQSYLFAAKGRRRRLFEEAEAWLMCGNHTEGLSFEYVCAALGLDPEYLRTGLRNWRARQIAPVAGHASPEQLSGGVSRATKARPGKMSDPR